MKILTTFIFAVLFTTAHSQTTEQLLSFQKILPVGWIFSCDSVKSQWDSLTVNLPSKYGDLLWKYKMSFHYPSIDGVVFYGKDNAQQRTEHPQRVIYIYESKYKPILIEKDNKFKSKSSYCPKGLKYAETKDYFIALNVCANNLSSICQKETEKLDQILASFFNSLGH